MRTPANHRLFLVSLSVYLGWGLALAGRGDTGRGPAEPVAGTRANRSERLGAGQNPSTAPVQPPAGTRAVQVPPLQAPADVPAPGNPVVVFSTSFGDITVELFKDRAPVSVANFLGYVTAGFYADTVFHRVRQGFMIQGGGYTAGLVEKPTRPPIQNEATNGLRNLRGTLAMARRAQLRSATSQFYINVADNRTLDHTGYAPDEFGYAVFGRVLDGMTVVDRIAAVATRTTADMQDVPVEPVIIKGAHVIK
jgi:cyclophilin family peptidyl-prolyl cis-trans isomerase